MPRRTLWLDDTTSVTVADGATSILNPTATYVDDKKGLTITRIIVSFQCRAASEVGGALGFQRVSMGLGMASDDAIEQGSAALPDPAVEAEFPVSGWLFRGTKLIILGVDPSPSYHRASPQPFSHISTHTLRSSGGLRPHPPPAILPETTSSVNTWSANALTLMLR